MEGKEGSVFEESFSMVLLGSICRDTPGASRSEMSNSVFLYILLAAISETKGPH